MRAASLICAALCLPQTAVAYALTFNLAPDTNPDNAVFCTLSLSQGEFSAVQAKGLGLQHPRALRWWATDAETTAFLTGMQALIDGRAPSENPLLSPRPSPPFLTVTWIGSVDGQIVSGRYTAHDLFLPAELASVLDTVTPGSYCGPSDQP